MLIDARPRIDYAFWVKVSRNLNSGYEVKGENINETEY